MQTIVRRAEDATRELGIQAKVALDNLVYAVAERAREERGQAGAEYMGILMIVGVIIGAIFMSGIGSKIATLIGQMIDAIADGSQSGPAGGGGGGGGGGGH
jgi:hypothetical protein